jgi:hypothetical protein
VRRAAVIGLALVAVLLAAAATQAAPAQQVAGTAAPTVEDALSDLGALDTRIDKLLEQVKSGEVKPGGTYLKLRAREAFARFPTVLGLAFVSIGPDLVKIDKVLGEIAALKEKDAKEIEGLLTTAEIAAGFLEDALKKANAKAPKETPAGAADVAESLADEAQQLVVKIQKFPNLTLKTIKEEAKRIETHKHDRFVKHYLTAKAFNLKPYQLFELAYPVLKNPVGQSGNTKEKEIAALEAVKAAKEKLIAALKEANPAKAKCPKSVGVACLYRFAVAGTLRMDWQWPPDQMGNRQSEHFDVTAATACGATPAVRWQVSTSAGPVTADFPANNPARLARYAYGTVAEVVALLRLKPGKQPTVALEAQPNGDVAGVTINPSSAKVTAKPVSSCP